MQSLLCYAPPTFLSSFTWRYFSLHDSLRVRRVALDGIPGAAGKHSEGGAWSTQPT
jgi:hypothetical protein